MNTQEKLDLRNLKNQLSPNYEDNTDGIRKTKHSEPIMKDIIQMEKLKKEHAEMRKTDPNKFSELCQQECIFLFNTYTDIYNRLLRDELDLNIMVRALSVLKHIEEGKINQEEGSVIVGKLFHELFVDSALKRSENLDKEYASQQIPKNAGSGLSYKDFKQMKNKKDE